MLNPIDDKYGIISSFSNNFDFYKNLSKNCILDDIGEAIYQAQDIENILYLNGVNIGDENVINSIRAIVNRIIEQIPMNRLNHGYGEPMIPLNKVKADGLKKYFHIELETSRK